MDQPAAPDASPPISPTESAPTTTIAPPQKPFMHRAFLSDEGLRSGWSVLLYLLMVVAIGMAFGFLLRIAHPGKFSQLWGMSISEAVSLVVVIIPALVMAKIEGRPFAAYGLPKAGAFGRWFWLGMLWGIVWLTVLMLALRSVGAFYFGSLALGGMRLAEFAVFWMVFFVFVGLFEEFLLRGYTQFTLTRGIGFWPSALLLSFAFGAIHLKNEGEDPIGALGAALIGLFLCLTLRRTGNLWFAVGLHASWDWGETFLYSVANSGMVAPGHMLNSSFHGPRWLTGGSVGPEASIFVFIVMALMFVVFHLMYPQKKYPSV